MNFPHFFIDRPIFAGVISIVITLLGVIALSTLPIAQYPEIAPPTVQVTTSYPGANAKVVAETVATPIEQQVNGVENMLYMSSQSTSDGNMVLSITFKLGTDLDTAQVLVQNRVAIAIPILPPEVQRIGVTTKKQSPDITMVVHLVSPDGSLDQLFTSNYALLQIRDELARLDGVGDINVFGAREYSMRLWLDPNKIASRDLTAQDVVAAIQEQNVQVAAGIVGAPPVPKDATAFQYTVSTQGRLADEKEFGEIVVKTGANGQVTRVRDIARVELAARDYTVNSGLGGKPATAIAIFQLPGSNALATSDVVRKKMAELKQRFPTGLDYTIVYDPTVSVRESIHEVQKTLFEAIALVVLVVLVFLQTWRAAIIPLIAIPVSLIGTFAAMLAFGFSINNVSLFGIVLAIGIVVDDAIVVVEAIEHHIESGLNPRDAARKAMTEVGGALVAIALVLCSVFIPTAFIAGITGTFFRQFALTIAVSTAISALNSLTLSPALAALLLRPRGAKRDLFQRVLDGLLGWFFKGFNKLFAWSSNTYGNTVARLTRLAVIVLFLYAGLLGLTALGFKVVPGGFLPTQDRGYAVVYAQLPDASSLDRTQAVVDKIAKIARETPGILNTVEFAGFNLFGGNQTNTAAVFLPFKEFSERTTPEEGMPAIVAKMNARVRAEIPEAFVAVFPPPPVAGIGNAGGYRLFIQDRGNAGLEELQTQAFAMMMKANQTPGLANNLTTFRADVPQLWLDVDRVKAKSMNVPLSNIFGTLQTYLGSTYVNDLTLFGRSYRVDLLIRCSGNTGMGLAIAAVVKGYRCIFTTTDKQSKEKIDALKAFGAEVIVCPTNVDPEDPRSYYAVSSRLRGKCRTRGRPTSTDNLSNSAAHYELTAPEIWEQTGGRITHLVVGVGTGGTISGVGRYLKERNPKIKVWGIDTYGSVFKKQGDRRLRQERDLSLRHRGHRRGLPAEERRFRRHRSLREGHRQGRSADDPANRL